MIESLRNIWNMHDLRKRILFTLGILAVYRVGAFIPTPGINTEALREIFDRSRGTVLGFLDLFSGGNFGNFTIFALGITPYITASIILQLMTVVWPYLERLSKEGELGRKKITQYTRYLTVILSLVQSFGIASLSAGDAGRRRVSGGSEPRVWIRVHDHADPDDGNRIHHVAGRKDHREGYRKWNVPDHLCRNCQRPAQRRQ